VTTAVWMGRVRPEWTVRVDGENGGAADSAPLTWQQADDAALVQGCLAGPRDAFDVIVERHRRAVYQVCYRYVGNHEDAADLAQDTFVRAYKGLKGFKGQSTLATWLYRIAINVCLNRVSLKTPRTTSIDPIDRPDLRHERADAKLLREERAAAVRAAIAQLPRKQRATLILRIYHDLPHEQIAGILGSSVGAAKANLFHALANLKKLLK
jgi:RNA polymerase sigma-70 factor (ECF subfamily)